MIKNKCFECVFWLRDIFFEQIKETSDDQIGICRRYPPTVIFDNEFMVDSNQPEVLAGSWCGEFKLSDMPDVWLDLSIDFFLRDVLEFIRKDNSISREDFYSKYSEWCYANKFIAKEEFLFVKQISGLGIFLDGEDETNQSYKLGIKDCFADEFLSYEGVS